MLTAAACGGGGGGTTEPPGGGIGGENQGTILDEGYVYLPEFIDVNVPNTTGFSLLAVQGDTLFVQYTSTEGDRASGLATLRTDGTGFQSIWEGENEWSEEDGVSHFAFQGIMSATPLPQGGILAIWQDHAGYSSMENFHFEEAFYLMTIDASGTIGREVDISTLLGVEEGVHVGINRVQVLPDGRVLIGAWDTMYVLSSDWTLERQIPWEAMDFVVAGNGQVLASVWGEEGGAQVFPFDLETGELDQSGDSLFSADLWGAVPGQSHDLYVGTSQSVYGFDLETRRSTQLFNWMDLDMMSWSTVFPAENGELFFFEQQWDGEGTSGGTLVRLTRRPASEAPQRTILTFGTVSMDWELRREIIEFNKRNLEYRIEVREYWNWMSGEEWADAITRLNTDIITGNAPDILDFGMGPLPYEQYARRGFLADLGALIDGDSELSRAGLVEPVMSLMEIDGTLYTVASQFTIQTLVGRSDLVGPNMGWTMDEFLTAVNALPEGATAFDQFVTRQQFMSRVMGGNLGAFIDRETGQANFDSPLFRAYLEFAQSLLTDDELFSGDWGGGFPGDWARPVPMPIAEVYEETEETSEEADEIEEISERIEIAPPIGELDPGEWFSPYATGQVLLLEQNVFGFTDLQFIMEQFGGDVTFIGYPSESGIGSVIVPRQVLGISATSRHADAAWSFVRTILTANYQRDNVFQFPTNRAILEEQIDRATSPTDEMRGWGVEAVSQQQIDQVMALLNQTTQLYVWDETVIDMITEETLPFFAGDRSVDETVRIIQSRVQMYLSERG